MKTYCGVKLQHHSLLILALEEGEWSVSCPGRFTPVERVSSIHWVGGWVGPRAGLDAVEKRRKSPTTQTLSYLIV
jgi:hypothetical protein